MPLVGVLVCLYTVKNVEWVGNSFQQSCIASLELFCLIGIPFFFSPPSRPPDSPPPFYKDTLRYNSQSSDWSEICTAANTLFNDTSLWWHLSELLLFQAEQSVCGSRGDFIENAWLGFLWSSENVLTTCEFWVHPVSPSACLLSRTAVNSGSVSSF